MKKTFLIFSLLLMIGFANWGCARQGCTDKDSINYDSKAGKDDGSCAYTGKVLVWFNAQTAALFQTNFEADSFYLYINDIMVGSMKVTDSTSAAPGCDVSNGAYPIYLGTEKSGNCTLYFKKPVSIQNPIVKSVNITVPANDCYIYQLVL